MSIMIPSKPKTFSPSSLENLMFDALCKLSNEYFVFHSFKIVQTTTGILYETEADFLIFNRTKGILIIEAKAGKISYENGIWFYSNGIPMPHEGPFNQANRSMWNLRSLISDRNLNKLLHKCKFLNAVWFPSIDDHELKLINLPLEADSKLILTKSALSNPAPIIEKIFEIEIPNRVKTNVTSDESKQLIETVLCPKFEVCPSKTFDLELKNLGFHKLLQEQSLILSFIEDQKSAVIHGIAGTGKTMIAIEKAKRHSYKGEMVLFLCYNSKLKEFLNQEYQNQFIDFYTLDGFGSKICNKRNYEYKEFFNKLEDLFLASNFPYQHIIIDEGQDFGQESIEESRIIELMKTIVIDESNMGSFYIFYDKLQLVQGKQIPDYISDAECKLTLSKNCRNTINIAKTSMRPFLNPEPRLSPDCISGKPPRLYYTDSENNVSRIINNILKINNKNGITDIIILSCKTEISSDLAPFIVDGCYLGIPFTTQILGPNYMLQNLASKNC